MTSIPTTDDSMVKDQKPLYGMKIPAFLKERGLSATVLADRPVIRIVDKEGKTVLDIDAMQTTNLDTEDKILAFLKEHLPA